MWRLIFFGLIIWLVIHLFKQHLRQSNGTRSDAEKTSIKDNAEDMVKCEACAVHLPRSEAFLVDNSFYCCKMHIPQK
jgi:hypothetical protein